MASRRDQLYIKELPPDMTEDLLVQIFQPYGEVVWCRVLEKNGKTFSGTGQSIALVQFKSDDEAAWILDNLNGNIPETLETPINVSYASPPKDKAKGAGKFQSSATRQKASYPWRASPYGNGAGRGAAAGQIGAPNPASQANVLMGADGRPRRGPTPAEKTMSFAMSPLAARPASVKTLAAGAGANGSSVVVTNPNGIHTALPLAHVLIKELPPRMKDSTVRALFEQYGEVVTVQMVEADTPGKCAAVIGFVTEEEATWVIGNLHGNIPQGLTMPITAEAFEQEVQEDAMETEAAPAEAPLEMVDTTGAAAAPNNLYIKGLPAQMTDGKVREIFEPYGSVLSTRILETDGKTFHGDGESVVLVQFAGVDEATWIVDNLNGNIPEGLERPICVRPYRKGAGRGKGR